MDDLQPDIVFPTTLPQPEAYMSVSSLHSTCTDLVLDASNSRGGLERDLNFAWTLSWGTNTSSDVNNMLLNVPSPSFETVTIPKAYLLPESVTITLTVTNWLG